MIGPRALLALFITAAAATPALADEPTVTVTFEDPEPSTPTLLEDQPINAQFRVFIDYNLPLGYHQDVVVELPLPDRAQFPVTTFITESASGSFVHSSTSDGLVETHRWTAASFDTAVAGRITLTVRFDSRAAFYLEAPLPVGWREFVTLTGTVFPFTATLSGASAPTADGPFVPFTPATTTATRTAVGTAILQHFNFGNAFERSGAVELNGVPGHLERRHYRMINPGNAGIRGYDWNTGEGGISWTIDIGPAAHFVRAWVGYQTGDYPSALWPLSSPSAPTISVLATPIPYGQPGHVTGGTVLARVDRHLTPYPYAGGLAYTDDFFVDVFLPCNGDEPLRADDSTTLAAHSPTLTVAGAGQPVWDDPDAPGVPAVIPRDPSPNPASPGSVPIGACGSGGYVAKSWGGTAAADASIAWNLAVVPPIGVPVIDGALVIDHLPAGTDGVFAYATGGGILGDFTTWYCDLPGVDYFDATDFAGYVGNECVPGFYESGLDVVPAGFGTPTHLVFEATSWGDGLSSIGKIDFTIFTHVRADYTSAVYGSEYANQAQFQGNYGSAPVVSLGNDVDQEPSPDGNQDDYESVAIRTVTDWSCAGIGVPGNYQPTLRELSPGDCSYVELWPLADPGLEPPRNAVFEVDVPDGVIITDVPATFAAEPSPVDGIWAAGSCTDPSGVIVAPTPADRPLRFELGTAAAPCAYYSSLIPLRIELCVDPSYPWADGSALDIHGRFVESVNQGTAAQCPPSELLPTSASASFTVSVPPEIQYFVDPSCRPEGGAAFTALATNSGGQDLTGVVLTLQVPRIASGSGADAAFDGVDQITNAPGAVVEVAVSDPPVAWMTLSALAGAGLSEADVRWVRLVDASPQGLTITALTGQPIGFRMLLTTSGTAGTGLTSTGRASANELSAPATATPPPFVIDSCANIQVLKFHDADGDGVHDAGEAALPGWPFAVTSTTGAVVARGVTDMNGHLDVYLPAGTYAVSESLPAGVAAWAPTTPASDPATVQPATITVGGGDVELEFGNSCTCPDDADKCDHVPCTVTTDEAHTTASCDGAPVDDCPARACRTAVCDPDVGTCSYVAPACDAVDYYATVVDAAGAVLGNIHCVLEDGEPPSCDMEPDGHGGQRLRIILPGTPGAMTCGPSHL